MNRRGAENAIPLLLLAVAGCPALWVAQGAVWVAPWCLTFTLYFLSSLLGVLSVWWMVGWSSWKPSVGEAGGVVLGLVVLVAVAEGGARLDSRWSAYRAPARARLARASSVPAPPFVADARLGWRLGPDVSFDWTVAGASMTYRGATNGFRVVTSTLAGLKGGDSPLVTVGGDFSFGIGVSSRRTFGARVATAMQRTPQLFALPSYDMLQRAAVMADPGLATKPHAILVGFVDPGWRRLAPPAPGLNEMSLAPPHVTDDGTVDRRRDDAQAAPPLRWLEAHSALWQALYAVDRALGRYFVWGDVAMTDQRIFARMYREAQAAAVPVLFVRLPLPEASPHPFLEDIFFALGAPYLDLNDPRWRRPGPLHDPKSGLLDRAGHEWVAQRIKAALDRHLRDARSDLPR